MATTEKWVQSRIRNLLDCRGIPNEKVWGNSINAGYPDLFCGSFWIEVKAPGRKLRPSQVAWFEKFVPRGCKAYVCDDPRKLWTILGADQYPGVPGHAPSNWKEFAPRGHHGTKMAKALDDFTRSDTESR